MTGKKKRRSRALLWVIVALVLLTAAFFGLKDVFLRTLYPLEYEREIAAYAKSFGLDPYLVSSVVWAESRFDQAAVSSKGAVGLMQIMPDTGEWIAKKIGADGYDLKQLRDPDTNIRFGCWYLHYLNGKFDGDRKKTLAAYNAGPGRVQDWLSNVAYSQDGVHLDSIPFRETEEYIVKIERAYAVYCQLYHFEE